MAGGANAWIMDVADTCLTKLLLDAVPNVHFVVAWTDRRTDEGEAVAWISAESLLHRDERVACDVRQRASLAGVRQSDGWCASVNDENRGAVGSCAFRVCDVKLYLSDTLSEMRLAASAITSFALILLGVIIIGCYN